MKNIFDCVALLISLALLVVSILMITATINPKFDFDVGGFIAGIFAVCAALYTVEKTKEFTLRSTLLPNLQMDIKTSQAIYDNINAIIKKYPMPEQVNEAQKNNLKKRCRDLSTTAEGIYDASLLEICKGLLKFTRAFYASGLTRALSLGTPSTQDLENSLTNLKNCITSKKEHIPK